MKNTVTLNKIGLYFYLLISIQFTIAQEIYNNGNFVTSSTLLNGTPCTPGNLWSELQSENGYTIITPGFGVNNNIQLADDFIVPNGKQWNITSLDFFVFIQYLDNYTFNNTDKLYVEIYNQDPANAGATPVFGNMTTSILNEPQSGLTNIYRAPNSINNFIPGILYDRKIAKLRANVSISLGPGTYWLVFKYVSTGDPNTTNVGVPQVVEPNKINLPYWNAKYKYGGVWGNLKATTIFNAMQSIQVQQELPFKINGTTQNILANDNCSGAFIVNSFPYNFTQNNGVLATNNGGFTPTCPMNDGEWFKVIGNGNIFNVNLLGVQANYDPKIGIYRGDCNQLFCFLQADNFGNGGSENLEFATTQGSVYYVNIGHYASGVNAPEGNFTLNLTGVLPNDNCTSAISVTTTPYSYNSSNAALATQTSFLPDCGAEFGSNDGEWFKIVGNGGNISIGVSPTSTYNPKISVYRGSCNSLTCVGIASNSGVGGSESYTINNSLVGTTYYINVGQASFNNNLPEDVFVININNTIALANESFELKNLQLYPNPVSNILTIENTESIDAIVIYNVLGQELIHLKNNNFKSEIDVSSFQAGNYLVKISSDNKEKTIKFIKI